MSGDAWPTESSPPELPQPTRITSFTRLGTELSRGAAACLPPLRLFLLGQGRGSQGKPRTQILRITTSWTAVLESFQQPWQNRKHTLPLYSSISRIPFGRQILKPPQGPSLSSTE